MKTIVKSRLAITGVIAVALCILLPSFDNRPGGDSFTIYLGDQLLVQQFVHLKEKTKTISLDQASANDVLKIHYSHCGKMGVSRNLVIRDQQNKALQSWKFDDSTDGDKGAMRIAVTDIRKLQKAAGDKILSLMYSSEQLPDGFILANIRPNDRAEASIK